MVKLNKIYTRTGDDGTTGLGTGERRLKYDLRVEAYGTVDETNAAIGMVRLHTGHSEPLVDAIESALRAQLAHGPYAPANVYGDGRAGERIVDLLAHEPLAPDLMNKVNSY